MIGPGKIFKRLEDTGIRQEEETVTPISGETVLLPYLIVRSEENDEWDDLGNVCFTVTSWRVTLFTANKDFALECKVRKALAGLGAVEVTRYPDGIPYSVDFAFITKGVRI